jgi:hypothetical protein
LALLEADAGWKTMLEKDGLAAERWVLIRTSDRLAIHLFRIEEAFDIADAPGRPCTLI